MSDASFAQGLIGITLDGRYRLDAVLGEGGMGSVFRATHLAMDRKVAVKLLKPHLTGDKIALERFSREARATLKVDSPHAVKVLDFGVTPVGDYYMVLEYLDGRTVQRELEIDGPFAPPRVAHIARQALHALGAAHAQGLIHRDVKPENLLLMRAGSDGDYTKILDFGVAKLMQGAAGDPAQLALTAAGMVFGTPEFMSPEQACGQPLDGRSDLYSLAATMFAMLTGTTLFEGTTAIEWLTHHVRTPAPQLAMVRPELAAYPELDALLQRCLAKQRELRPETAAEMAQLLAELEPALTRSPASAPPRTASRPGPIHASGYVEVLRDPGSTLLPAVAAPPLAAGPAAPPQMAAPPLAGGRAPAPPPTLDPTAASAPYRPASLVDSTGRSGPYPTPHRRTSLIDRSAAAQAADPRRPSAPSRRSRRRLALWIGGAAVASVLGVALGLSMAGPDAGSDAVSGAGSAAAPSPPTADRATAAAPAGAVGTPATATTPAGGPPVSAGPGASAAVATTPTGGPTPVSAGPVAAGAPGAGATASSGSVASTSPAPPSTTPRGAAAQAGPAPDRHTRPATATTASSAHRPPRAAAPGDPQIEELLKQAEDAYRRNLTPLKQLGPAGAVLRAQPGNLRAHFLAGDALIKDEEIELGCKHLAMAKALPVAQARARAAGCPGD